MKRTRNLILSGIFAFVLGWLLMLFDGFTQDPRVSAVESKKKAHSSHPRFGQPSIEKTSERMRADDPSKMDFSDYFIYIQNLRSTEKCENCFKNIMEDTNLPPSEKKIRMAMLLTKYGELAPRQAIQKVLETISPYDMATPWLSWVFSGWAAQDPESAVLFFDENNDPRIRKNPLLPLTLVEKWVEYSPKKAWNWLVSQDKNSFLYYEHCKKIVIYSMSEHNVDEIPEFIAELNEQDAKLYSPKLWRNWFRKHPDSPEKMASLSGENKTEALIGSISGKIKGNLDILTQELSAYNHEEQQKILFGLARDLIYGDKTQKEQRLHWLMDNAPGALLQDSVKYSLQSWFHESRTDAKDVLNSLPPSREKEALMEVYNSPPLQNFSPE